MLLALGLIEAHAAGKNDVGLVEEQPLALAQLGGRAQEAAELVHAVVDRRLRAQLIGKAERHWGVIPADVVLDPLGLHEIPEELALHIVGVTGAGQVGTEHPELGLLVHHLKRRGAVAVVVRVEPGLFPEEDAAILGAAGKQVLGALRDKMPAQMTEAEQIRLRGRSGATGCDS